MTRIDSARSARPDRDPRRLRVDRIEQCVLGAGHPHLPAPRQPIEQRRAAGRIEMRRDLVEQQDRRLPGPLGDQLGMREDDAKQQRLLLAGRGERRRALSWCVTSAA
ncbi:hypothetical protein NI18_07365, partial [Sphingomonas sp. Ant20]